MSRSCEEDPAFDYLLTLFLEATGEPLTVLPTHRIVTGVTHGGELLVDRARDLFDVEPVDTASALVEPFERAGLESGGRGRFGLWTREGGALLTARRDAFANLLPPGGEARARRSTCRCWASRWSSCSAWMPAAVAQRGHCVHEVGP